MKNILFFLVLIASISYSQKTNIYKSAIIAFYNVENFYDTIPSKKHKDEEFTPTGARNYNTTIYYSKLNNIAYTIAGIGQEAFGKQMMLPALIGLAEIENELVLNDLINHSYLRSGNYSFIHFDSKDVRGIDVALLYQPNYFKILQSKPLSVILSGKSKESKYTRDILWVEGWLDGELVDVYVNHWPSRYGGTQHSESARLEAAQILKNHIDSIKRIDYKRKILVMGDFNDNPNNASIYNILGAKEIKAERYNSLYNPFFTLFKNGNGTLAFQDAWSLFDQIILSTEWIDKQQSNFYFYKCGIYNASYLLEPTGKYKGYPMRSWEGMQFKNGYSDHLPTYIILLKNL
jgi:hypothetical protein